jgi:hypothetical protein
MIMSYSATEKRDRATGPVEPEAIILVGGPLNGKKVADFGQTKGQTAGGEVYRRVRMDADNANGRVSFDVLAYWGKACEQD